jgi:hypothetical protein
MYANRSMDRKRNVLAAMALGTVIVISAVASAVVRSASAAPPTVMPSPGYDARLSEGRRAAAAAAVEQAPVRAERPRLRRSVKQRRHSH